MDRICADRIISRDRRRSACAAVQVDITTSAGPVCSSIATSASISENWP
jgi:hypothetical protein